MTATIEFPFDRNERYPLGQMRAFHRQLFNARGQDRSLSAAIRGRQLPWAKLWSEELAPTLLFANHNRLPDADTFRVMPDGDVVDVEITSAMVVTTALQITTAYPEWGVRASGLTAGHIRHLERVGINQGIPVFGGGLIEQNLTGDIASSPRVLSPDIDRQAWQAGLRVAIDRKLKKAARYVGRVDYLLVYAEYVRFNTIDEDTTSIVLPAILNAVATVGELPFQRIIVLDSDPLVYVEYPAVSESTLKYADTLAY